MAGELRGVGDNQIWTPFERDGLETKDQNEVRVVFGAVGCLCEVSALAPDGRRFDDQTQDGMFLFVVYGATRLDRLLATDVAGNRVADFDLDRRQTSDPVDPGITAAETLAEIRATG